MFKSNLKCIQLRNNLILKLLINDITDPAMNYLWSYYMYYCLRFSRINGNHKCYTTIGAITLYVWRVCQPKQGGGSYYPMCVRSLPEIRICNVELSRTTAGRFTDLGLLFPLRLLLG